MDRYLIVALLYFQTCFPVGSDYSYHFSGRPYRLNGETYWFYCYGFYADLVLVKQEIDDCIHMLPTNVNITEVDQLDPAVPFLVCIMKNVGVVKDNKLDKNKFSRVMEEIFYREVRPSRTPPKYFAKCQKKHGTGLSEEDNYASYVPFMKCLLSALTDICFKDTPLYDDE